jgi:hypothetical protein
VKLDTVCDRYVSDGAQIVLKLDVEGAEVEALQGAAKLLLERCPLLVYEDHGKDPDSKVSEFVLGELGMNVYYCTDQSTIVRMRDVAAIRGVKKRTRRGYNFFACAPNSVFVNYLATSTG